ncbi:MAG: hypothetical protein ABFS17_01925 [Chloroflexota bacterium]
MEKVKRAAIRLDLLGLFLAGLNNTFLAFLVAIFIHGPGTTTSQPDLLLRASYIAENTMLWKAGWLFWFAPTLTFSWSYFALGRHLDKARQWRNLAIGVALIAAAVDIVGVLVNLTVLPELAGELTYLDPTLQVVFLSMEKLANTLTNIGGFGLYSLAGILLLPAVFATPDFPRWLRWLGVVEWGISILATVLLIVVPSLATGPLLVSFMLYAPWVWGSAWWLWQMRSEV